MKNAYVLEHHHGDDGTVSEGMILKDVATKRYDALEASGLVREASAEEVEKGYQPPFTPDDTNLVTDGEADEASPPAASKKK